MNNEREASNATEGRRKLPGWVGALLAYLGWFVLGGGYIYLQFTLDLQEGAMYAYGVLTILVIILLFVFKQWGFGIGLCAAVVSNFILAGLTGFKMDDALALLRHFSVPLPAVLVIYLLIGGQ